MKRKGGPERKGRCKRKRRRSETKILYREEPEIEERCKREGIRGRERRKGEEEGRKRGAL